MKSQKKYLALLLALVMALSCLTLAAAEETARTTPFPGDKSLTVTTSETDQSYQIYQIFQGSASATIENSNTSSRLADVRWGASIQTGNYNLTATLISALQDSTLPDGTTTNPVAPLFAGLVAESTDTTQQSTAADVARALQTSTTAAQQQAFAQIVGYVIQHSEATVTVDNAPTETTGANGTSYVFSNIAPGYYLVEDTAEGTHAAASASRYLLDVSTENATMDVKTSDNPTLEKKIVTTASDNTETLTDSTNAAIGDTVTFQLTSVVPTMTNYNAYFFLMEDTLCEGLSYTGNMTVQLVDPENPTHMITLTNVADLTSSSSDTQWYRLEQTTDATTGTTTLKIVFHDFDQYEDQSGYRVVVRYDATVTTSAVIGTAANASSAVLTYSDDPNYVYLGVTGSDSSSADSDLPGTGEPTDTTVEDTVYVYTTALDLHKVTSDGAPATGTTFRLTGANLDTVVARTYSFQEADSTDTSVYYKLTSGLYTDVAPTEETKETYVTNNEGSYTTYVYTRTAGADGISTTGNYKASDVNADANGTPYIDFTVDENGYLHLEGLMAGTYTLEEITAPTGYDVLYDPITITVSWTAPTETSTDCSWTFAESHNALDNGYVALGNSTDGRGQLTITDRPSPILPSTGGIGTTIFYVAGSILVVSALVLLITKRRMKHLED